MMLKGRPLVQSLMYHIRRKTQYTEHLENKTYLHPYTYMLKTPGKVLCSKLAQAYNVWLGLPEQNLNDIIHITQLFHHACMMVDGAEDNSQVRRGLPTAHKIYGVANTINAANYIYFYVLQEALRFKHPDAVKVCIEQGLEIHRGQGIELEWKENCICPTEEQYKHMIMLKSAAVYMFPLRLMKLLSTNKSNFEPFIKAFGLYFQIQDDYCDLYNRDDASLNDDISEGQYTFPIVHAIQTYDQDNQLKNILRQRTRDPSLKKHFVSLLKSYGSFEYTHNILVSLEQETRNEVKKLGENPIMEKILDELLTWKKM